MSRKILVTSALPYANGSIHIGHLVEYIQTDIWVRFQKLMGNDCAYMCADDTHGTPIMLSAKHQGISPQELIEKVHQEHFEDFKAFNIEFDHYYTTDSPENKEFAEYIYNEAKANGVIYEKEIEQSYCEKCAMFLPDRFIKGACPVCSEEDQYGDSCEKCSATYTPEELKNPFCVECGASPVKRKSVHHFFKLSELTDVIKSWLDKNPVRSEIKNKLNEWFESGIRDWDISRDAPYFGFKIPGTDDKYFYVWMDAPIGYISTTKKWCEITGQDFDQIWRSDDVEIHHFIGKDILYFHTLFWPAMLSVAGFSLPNKVHIHGFLTVNGEKMSKSRGTFISAKQCLEYINPEFLRYYYAAKLSPGIDDIDLSFEDFTNRVNADVVNKLVNIGSRLGAIVFKRLDAKLTTIDADGQALIEAVRAAKDQVAEYYENLEYNKAMRLIMELAGKANQYIDEKAPWAVVKEDAEKAAQICTAGLNVLRCLAIYLKPVIPQIVLGIESFLNIESLQWGDLEASLENHTINKYQHLAQRVELSEVAGLIK
jgi:methionyl-tRNA synthetase